eukprot:jgi/Tetstr1/457582/TSEL_044150.t1
MREYVAALRVFEGRKFPREAPSVLLSATFAGETQFRSVVKGTTRSSWEAEPPVELRWELDSEGLRGVTNSGNTICKLTVSDVGTGAVLGWLALDLRTAKLNGAKKEASEGEWMMLSGGKHESAAHLAAKGPQMRVFYTFREKAAEPDAPLAPPEDEAVDRVARRGHAGSPPPDGAPEPAPASECGSPEGQGRRTEAAVSSPAAAPAGAAELVRRFKLAVDLRSIKAFRALPVNLASVFVQAFLPAEVKGVVNAHGRKAFPIPVKTYPATDVARGTEITLPNGYAEVEFVTDVMTLASTLAAEPQLVLEVWHKERLKRDMMLGMASVPLSVLLQEPWVDRYAAVYAMLAVPGEGERKTQVASVRLVLSLEELGVAVAEPSAERAPSATPPVPTRHHGRSVAEATDAGAGPSSSTAGAAAEPNAPAGAGRAEEALPVASSSEGPSAAELHTAYELEQWKIAEERRWRAELAEREAERLGILEAEWRAREKARDDEARTQREAYAALEERTRSVLKEMAAREAKLVAAEESLASRRAELERAAAARISEAEAAVRRLQLECEHQLDLERHRNEELARSASATEAKLRTAEARADAVEAAFAEYRESQRHTSEAALQTELAEARREVSQARQRACEAVAAKEAYKSRVVRLASDLSALQRARAADQVALLSSRAAKMDGAATGLMAGGQVLAARAQASDLAHLRAQLEALRASLGHSGGATEQRRTPGKENAAPLAMPPPGARVAEHSAPVAAELTRLRAEREGLVGSGLYAEEDPLVVEVDKQIAALER